MGLFDTKTTNEFDTPFPTFAPGAVVKQPFDDQPRRRGGVDPMAFYGLGAAQDSGVGFMQALQVMQQMGLIGNKHNSRHITGVSSPGSFGLNPETGRYDQVSTPSDHGTPPDVWAKMFSTPEQVATKESVMFGLPYDQTPTAKRLAFNALPANERMNQNMGITNDMTPEQRGQINARMTSMKTGKPIETYLPQAPLSESYIGQDGTRYIMDAKNHELVGSATPGDPRTPNNGTIDGIPAQAALAAGDAAWAKTYPGVPAPKRINDPKNTYEDQYAALRAAIAANPKQFGF